MSRSGYQQRIRARVAELRQRIAADQAELTELEVAERVLERLGGSLVEGGDQGAQHFDVRSGQTTKEPTVAEVAIRILTEFGPLNSGDLLQKMQEDWRPDLAQTTLASTLSRTKKEGRIVYENGLWAMPRHDINSYSDADTSNSEVDTKLGGTESTSEIDDLL